MIRIPQRSTCAGVWGVFTPSRAMVVTLSRPLSVSVSKLLVSFTLFTHLGVREAIQQCEEDTLEASESKRGERPETVMDGRHGERSGDSENVVGAKQRQQHERCFHGFPIHHSIDFHRSTGQEVTK